MPVNMYQFHDAARLFVSARKLLRIKEKQILFKMHFKPIGSSAVDELLKLIATIRI